jgi:hypothetical protein
VLAGRPVPALIPLLSLHDQDYREIMFLGPEQDDLVYRVSGALRGLAPGDTLAITVSRDRHAYCLDVNGTSTCGLGFTLGIGWAFFLYSQALPAWLHVVLNGTGWQRSASPRGSGHASGGAPARPVSFWQWTFCCSLRQWDFSLTLSRR